MYTLDLQNGILGIDNKRFKLEHFDSELQFLEPNRYELGNVLFTVNDYPKRLIIMIKSEDGFGTNLFTEMNIRIQNGKLIFKFGAVTENRYWKDRWGMSTFLATLHHIVSDLTDDVSAGNIEIESDWRGIELDFAIPKDFVFETKLQECVQRIRQLIKQTEMALSGVVWRRQFQTDEKSFCTDLLYPLLRKMLL